MAETGGHQSSHISSSSVGEKGGSCAELHPKHPSPESPGSPFEMIANSSGFEFKDCEDRALSHGLSQISTQRPLHDQSPKANEPILTGYKNPSCVYEEKFISTFPIQDVLTHRPEDFEPGHLSEPNKSSDHQFSLFHKGNVVKPSEYEDCTKPNLDPFVEVGSVRSEDGSYDAKTDLRWPDAEEDMDSSGESDDTVIDAGWRVKASLADQREHAEDGWVELGDAHKGSEPRQEAITRSENVTNNSKALPLGDSVPEKFSSTISKTPDSPHSEGFVDLAETCVSDPHTEATRSSESESSEDKVQESLTIEALKALAAGVQEWNSESRESSPEVLSPQFSNFKELRERPDQAELQLGSTVGFTAFKVHDLLYWRDVKKSGMVFGGTMVLLLSLAAFSIISVISYLILALLTVTISFRIYKSVMQAVQKSDEGHPFKALLDKDITLSSENLQKKANASLGHVNHALKYIVRLFLVEDLVDSLKFALLMWLMTYVGAVFNGITLLILGVLVAFSAPIVYEKYKVQIDHYVSLVHGHVKSITEKIQAKLPAALKKKTE
ncbi:reticulon-3 isoform X1 [Dendropsophus ebraccatus]|uniref:reticulon-3 isoform X1 n=1 Tax=Dendropsophus ebraccatus TaxID=150705 RepID=UPI003831491F